VSSIKRGILLKRAVFLKWWDTEFFNFWSWRNHGTRFN
jgi:hypothetical protein